MRKLLDILIIVSPIFWFMGNKYNKDWDKFLKESLNKFNFTEIDDHKAKLGEIEFWVANYPYACFSLYPTVLNVPNELMEYPLSYLKSCRPSKITILRARRKLLWDKKSKSDKRECLLSKLGV